jgi:hypothetical protein
LRHRRDLTSHGRERTVRCAMMVGGVQATPKTGSAGCTGDADDRVGEDVRRAADRLAR